MKHAFAETENYRRLLIAVDQVKERAAREAGMILVTSEPGYGKTRAVQRYAVLHGAVYMRAMTHWTPHLALSTLVSRLGAAPEFGRENLLRQAAEHLRSDTEQRTIIVDEAEHLLHDTKTLETLRDLSDSIENIVILVGMEKLRTTIQRYAQVASRIARAVSFQPASLADVRSCSVALADVALADDIVAEIHHRCQGRLRLAINAIARVERRSRLNNRKQAILAEVRDVIAEDDWRRGKGFNGEASK